MPGLIFVLCPLLAMIHLTREKGEGMAPAKNMLNK